MSIFNKVEKYVDKKKRENTLIQKYLTVIYLLQGKTEQWIRDELKITPAAFKKYKRFAEQKFKIPPVN